MTFIQDALPTELRRPFFNCRSNPIKEFSSSKIDLSRVGVDVELNVWWLILGWPDSAEVILFGLTRPDPFI